MDDMHRGDTEETLSRGEQLRREALADLGLSLQSAHEFHDLLASSVSVEVGGFPRFSDIASFRVRATASDLVLTAADAVESNMTEAALHSRAYASYVGPNGKTMPGPETTTSDHLDSLRAEADLVGFFRAIGSTLDCVAACVVGVLRLPQAIDRADAALIAGGLDRLLNSEWTDSMEQVRWATRIADLLQHHRRDPNGWLEWSVEMRNRVVHRSRQLNVWLPKAGRRRGPKLELRTKRDLAHLIRTEPHLRRRPWLPEMESLRLEGGIGEQWLVEPAPRTLTGVLGNMNALIEAVFEDLATCWRVSEADTVKWGSLDQAWQFKPRPEWRLALAEQFQGFDRDYYVPPLSQMRVSRRDAPRLEIAERLRRGGE